MSQKEQVSSEQSICFLPALGTVPLSSSMVYVTVILQPLLPHYSFLLSADIPHSPPSSYSSLAPLLLHHLILNIRNPLPPYNPGTWAFTLLHRAPGALSAFSHIPGWGQESLWLQKDPLHSRRQHFFPSCWLME